MSELPTFTTPERFDGYSVEPGLVDAGDSEPDWVSLFPLPSCHPTLPTAEQTERCFALGIEHAGGEADCYLCERDSCENCWGLLTPRMAFFLHLGAVLLSDYFEMDLEAATVRADGTIEPDSSSWFQGELPRLATASMTEAWACRFIACFDTIAGRLASGRDPEPNCTGEEMALHIIIAFAEGHYHDGVTEEVFGDYYAEFPVHEHDEDFDRIRDLAFEDHDVLWLFDDALDGIEASTNPVNQQLGIANLHPTQWFLPFREKPAVT
jgi:hypothetical protein